MNIAGCPGLEDKMRVAIITASDAGAAGTREDLSGVEIRRSLEAAGYTVTAQLLLPDEREELAQAMKAIADDGRAELILTTGGTGLSPRDVTPEATQDVAVSAIRGQTLIINLPGSPKAVRECLEYLLPTLEHGLEILTGQANNCARQ